MELLNDKITGGTLTAAEWNQVPSELQNVIENLGITLSGGDLNQLGKAIAGYVANGNFYTDSGVADAYVLATIGLKQSPTAYTNGMAIEFDAGNANTGASTVNVAGLGVKDIQLTGGTPLAANDIDGRTRAVFNSAGDRFEIAVSDFATGQVIFSIDTGSGSYVKPAGLINVTVTLIGGGAGGGGAAASGGGQTAGGSGGGAAGIAMRTFIPAELAASENYTIGSGGTGGVGSGNGLNGGFSDFGTFMTSLGGNGGLGGLPGAGHLLKQGGLGGIVTGIPDLATTGGSGGDSSGISGCLASVGMGGSNRFGAGGRGITISNGENGLGFGSGGGGGSTIASGPIRNGGTGACGVIIFMERF